MDHLLLLLLWSSGLGGGGRLASAAAQCEAAKADIVMLVDESGSISSSDFWEMLQFVEDIIKNFTIGPDEVQIGLSLFSSNPRTMWELNTHQTKESLLKAFDSLEQTGGGSNTGRALEHVLRYNFKYDMGMRPDSRKILVVFTDGESHDDVEEPAKHLRDSGIEVYAIGIGGASELQLLNITTDRAHMYILEDFSSLDEIANNFSMSLCNSTTAAQCEAAKADIVMLVDESGSISSSDFWEMLQFVEDIIKNFTIGPDEVQIGLTLFSRNPRTMWQLNTHQTKESLLEPFDSLKQMGGGTNTGRALEHVLRYNFKYDMGMRPDSRKILVVFTDGESNDDVVEPAEHLRDSGIEVYAIGIGGTSELQLLNITTDRAHMYILEDFSSLDENANNFSMSLCNSASEPLRLVGGASRCAGVLQVKLVEWRMVDGRDWSLKAAAAACTELRCGSAVLTASGNRSSESPGWSVDRGCVEAGWRLRECSTSTRSSSTVELVCSDLLERPVISASSVDGVSEAQQQGFRVSWRSSFSISCSVQPQYPGGSFQLSFTSSSDATLSRTQSAVNHSARFLFPAAGPAHRGDYTCVYRVHVFSRNFSSESRRLSLLVSDPTVFFIRLTLLLLSLLIFTSLICFSHKTSRKYERSPQEDVEVELQTRRRRRVLQEEQV